MRANSFLAAVCGAALLVAATPTPSNAVEIGVASSIRNDVQGDLRGARRDLDAGDGVSLEEVISTGVASAAQLLFEDSSTLTLGPEARLTLTRFIYDPDSGAGDVVTEVIEGGFRFVSGVARSGAYEVETPRLTIGVRGSIVEGYVDPVSGDEFIVLVQGVVEVCLKGGACVLITRPGDYVRVTSSGIVGPEPWPGPLLDQDAALDFAQYVDLERALLGRDPLPLRRDDDFGERIVIESFGEDDEFTEEEEEEGGDGGGVTF